MGISRNRAIEILQGQICMKTQFAERHYPGIVRDGFQETIEALEMAIAALQDYRWIPRSEREPTVKDQRGYSCIIMLDNCGGVRSWPKSSINGAPGGVTHWMPLPKVSDTDEPLQGDLRARFLWLNEQED